MKYALSTYLPVLVAFGPIFIIGRWQAYSAEHLAISTILGAVPYIGAIMLSVGGTYLLRELQNQRKEVAALRDKLAALEAR